MPRTIERHKPIELFVPFDYDRIERQGDALLVEGYAFVNETVTGENGIRLKRKAMENATPDYMRFGALREMHQRSAAGTCMAVLWDDRGAKITAKIVDPVARLKVEERVYKGFSVGVLPTVVRGKDVEMCEWSETSLVDRPKDPDALIVFRAAGYDPNQEFDVQVWDAGEEILPGESRDPEPLPASPLDLSRAELLPDGTIGIRLSPEEIARVNENPASDLVISRSVKQELNGQFAVYTPDGGTKLAEFKTRAEAEALDSALNNFLQGAGGGPNSAAGVGAMRPVPSDAGSDQRDPTGRKLLEGDLKEPERAPSAMTRIVIQEGEKWGVWNAERSQRFGLFDTQGEAKAYEAELARRQGVLPEAEIGSQETYNAQREQEAADLKEAMEKEVPQYAGATSDGTVVDPNLKGYAPQYGGATPDSAKIRDARNPVRGGNPTVTLGPVRAPSESYSTADVHPPKTREAPSGLYGGAEPKSAKVRAEEPVLTRIIEQEGDHFVLWSHDKSKKLGTFPSREAAEKREREIEYFKHEDSERAALPTMKRHHLTKEENGKFVVYSPEGKKLATFDTKEAADAYEYDVDPAGEAAEKDRVGFSLGTKRVGFTIGAKRSDVHAECEPMARDLMADVSGKPLEASKERGVTSGDAAFPARENLEGGEKKKPAERAVVPWLSDQWLGIARDEAGTQTFGPFGSTEEALNALARAAGEELPHPEIDERPPPTPAAPKAGEETPQPVTERLFRQLHEELYTLTAAPEPEVASRAEAALTRFHRALVPLLQRGQLSPPGSAEITRRAEGGSEDPRMLERVERAQQEIARVQGLLSERDRELSEAKARIERLEAMPARERGAVVKFTLPALERDFLANHYLDQSQEKKLLEAEFAELVERSRKGLPPDEAHAAIVRMGQLKYQLRALER